MAKFVVLSSSSAGNSSVIWGDDWAFLIDCGLDHRYIEKELSDLGLHWDNLTGVLITHSHFDHCHPKTIEFLMENKIPVYAIGQSAKALAKRNKCLYKTECGRYFKKIKRDNRIFFPSKVAIYPFPVPHDSKGGCYGFRFEIFSEEEDKKIVFATDLCKWDESIAEQFIDSDLIVVEANYNEEMLLQSERSPYLIRRIIETGHLSNEQTGKLLSYIIDNSKKQIENVMLIHISQECNSNEIAYEEVTAIIEQEEKYKPNFYQSYEGKRSSAIEV